MKKIRKKMFELKGLKGLALVGAFIYTDAKKDNKRVTGNNQKGLDDILENIGFQYEPVKQYGLKKSWMCRWTTGKGEKLVYHRINKEDPISNLAKSLGMKTRIYFGAIDFYASNAVYDVVKTLLNEGYQMMVPPIGKGCVDRLFHFTREKNGKLIKKEVKLDVYG